MKNKFLKTAFSEKLTEGESLSLGMNRIKDGKYYEFSARLDGELSDTAKVFICHGHMVSYGRWLEISEKGGILIKLKFQERRNSVLHISGGKIYHGKKTV